MVDYGFISIHRSLQSHWLWNEKPFDKRAAWIDLLLLANFQDNKFVLGNELVSVERGSFITSELKLMERWGWSKTKVRSFLKLLENDNMIVKKSDTKKTAITIVNYSVYQDKRTTKEPEKNHGETAEKLQKDTNNKDNKENKEKKDNITDYKSVYDHYVSLGIKRKTEYTETMAEIIKSAMKKNKYDIEHCKTLLDRHKELVDLTKNDKQFAVKPRTLIQFFGQKAYQAKYLICTEYDVGGEKYQRLEKLKAESIKNQSKNKEQIPTLLAMEMDGEFY